MPGEGNGAGWTGDELGGELAPDAQEIWTAMLESFDAMWRSDRTDARIEQELVKIAAARSASTPPARAFSGDELRVLELGQATAIVAAKTALGVAAFYIALALRAAEGPSEPGFPAPPA